MLNRSVAVALLALTSFPAQAGIIGFQVPFDPSTWTTQFIGDVSPPGRPDNGTINTAGAPGAITLTGGDDPSNPVGALNSCVGGGLFGCEIMFSHAILPGPISIAFHWTYTSLDSGGGHSDPAFRPWWVS